MTVAIKGNASITRVILCRCAINERAVRPDRSHAQFVCRQVQAAPTDRGSMCLRHPGMFRVLEKVFLQRVLAFLFLFLFFGLGRCHGRTGGGQWTHIVLHQLAARAATPTRDRAVRRQLSRVY